jgi:hypothetical protein
MTRSDAIRLVGLVITAYPNSDKFNNQAAVDNAVSLWAEFFEDDDVALVAMALKKHIATCKFPPQIAELKEIMLEICAPDIIPPNEAWAAVALFIDTSSEYECLSKPERIFPTAIANAIKAVGYRALRDLRIRRFDHSGKKTGLDRVAFLQAYESEYERERKYAMLPHSLQLAIAHTQAALAGEKRLLFEKTKGYLEAKQAEKMEMLRRLERADRRHLLETHNAEPLALENKQDEVDENE